MFSIILFIFVGLVLVAGFFAVTWRRRNKVPLDNDESAPGRERRPSKPSNSAFKEYPVDNLKGRIVPTDNKLSQNDFDDDNEMIK
jgi:hypothetical protein